MFGEIKADLLKQVCEFTEIESQHITRLTRLKGHTNQVFMLEQSVIKPYRSVIRIANKALDAHLCPLAADAVRIIEIHQQAADLKLAPPVIKSSAELGIMWLDYVGEQRKINLSDWHAITKLIQTWHHHPLAGQYGLKQTQTAYHLALLGTIALDTNNRYQALAEQLLVQAQQHHYANLPQVPVHSDLNPANFLHDGQRWWLIDWDFASMMAREWDYASLIVEHAWHIAQFQPWIRPLKLNALGWFCANFALLSWDWHVQRGSAPAIIQSKQQVLDYWVQHWHAC